MPDVSWYAIRRGGQITNPVFFPDGSAAAPSISTTRYTTTGFYVDSTNSGAFKFSSLGTSSMLLAGTGFVLRSSALLGINSVDNVNNPTADVQLSRSSAGFWRVVQSFNFTGPTTTGAQAATITNSPTIGNPSGWLIVQLEGASRYIPLWS